jgi:WD40 repeat protein
MLKPGGQIYSIAVAADGLLYTGSDSKSIRVWRHPDFPQHSCLKSGSRNVKALLVAGDQILSAHGDNKIRLWRRSRSNPNIHTRVATLPKLNIFHNFIRPLVTDHGTGRVKHSGTVTCLAYNVNDDLLYSASSDKSVKVWKVSESKCIETIEAHTEAVNAVVVRHDGLLFTGSDDSTVKVWRRPGRGRPKHELMMTLNMQRSPVKALALGPDGSPVLYAGCYDGYIHYWEEDQFSDRILHYSGFLRGHLHSVLCLETVRDLLLSGSADTTIRVWKREAGGTGICCIAVMEGHSGPVKCIAATITVNSFIAYSGSLDGMVKVWMGCMKTSMDSRPTSPLRIH